MAKTDWIQRRRTYAAFMAKRFVRFLTEQGVGKPSSPPTAKEIARAGLKRDYEAYLRRQRGLSERTIFHAWRFADRFLRFRFGDAIGDLSQVTSADIVDFLQHLTTRTPPFRDKTPSSHLRNFFRYLFKAGKTATNLVLGDSERRAAVRDTAAPASDARAGRERSSARCGRRRPGASAITPWCCCWPASGCGRRK